MAAGNAISPGSRRSAPRVVRLPLDDVDRAILRVLCADARIANKDLAEAVGIAQSTCTARLRALRARGVLRGFHADVDPHALGQDLQAMVAVRLHPHARGSLSEFAGAVRRRPEVLDVYFLGGPNDFLLHVATSSTDEVRRFVAEHLNGNRAVAHTETSLVFEHLPGAGRPGRGPLRRTARGPAPSGVVP